MKNRLRFGEWVSLISALALFGFLFLDWFALTPGPLTTGSSDVAMYPVGGISGWDSLGWLALALCVLTIVAGLALPLVFALYESPVLSLSLAVVCLLLGALTVIALIVQVIFQPGPDELVAVRSGWWLGLFAAISVARGGFLSMRDEYLPGVPIPDVPVRPAPPASPAA